MRIGILSRNDQLYSTNRLIEAARARGHEPVVIDYMHCYIIIEKGKPTLYYRNEPVTGIDAVIPRIGASYTFFGTAIVRQFEMMEVFTASPSQAIVRARDKLRAHQILSGKGVDMPSTGFARSVEEVQEIVKAVGGYPVILKLLEGTHGSGVVLLENKKQANATLEAFYSIKTQILIQEFIQESAGTDIRAFVIDGEVVGSMKRTAAEGEFRSNLHKGGTAEMLRLNKAQKALAATAAKAIGLHIAGVDMINSKRGSLILEVNSSPGLEGIETATRKDIASQIIEFVEKHANSKRKRDRVRA